jgi:hypothetical protein
MFLSPTLHFLCLGQQNAFWVAFAPFNNSSVCFLKCHVQWNLNLSFFKGVEKTNDEYGETSNPENHFFKKKIIQILPQLKI